MKRKNSPYRTNHQLFSSINNAGTSRSDLAMLMALVEDTMRFRLACSSDAQTDDELEELERYISILMEDEEEDDEYFSEFEEPEVVFGRVYRDEPLNQTGAEFSRRKVKQPKIDDKIKQMRKIAEDFGWHSYYYGGGRLFYEQAKFMEDYSCDEPYEGTVYARYPTYEDLTDLQLMGYFTWRSQWREKHVLTQHLTYVEIYAFEVLCGIGFDNKADALQELERLREVCAARENSAGLTEQFNRWIRDFVMYWNLDPALISGSRDTDEVLAAQLVAQSAQEALLAARTTSDWQDGLSGAPTKMELLGALVELGRNGIKRSKLLKDHSEELASISAQVFAKMVEHCHHRRNQDFMESTFGHAEIVRYFPFIDAVFYDPRANDQKERVYTFADGATFSFNGEIWYQHLPFRKGMPDKDLGNLMQTIDRLLRAELDVKPALRTRKIPAYQLKIVQNAIDSYFAEKRHLAELEKARVHIDRGQLSHIRKAASTTRDALLVDEEREDFVAAPLASPVSTPAAELSSSEETDGSEVAAQAETQVPKSPAFTSEAATSSNAAVTDDKNLPFGLTSDQLALIGSLLDGSFDQKMWQAKGMMVELEVDAINETLFDVVGDTVVEFVGDQPELVEDYISDVKEALGL